jgi:hypothetical protein
VTFSRTRVKIIVFAGLITTLISCVATKQLSAQAVPTATGPGGYISIGVTGSLFHVNYDKRWVGGGGLYVDANLYRKFGVEFQGQSLRYNQESGTRQTTYLAGPRYSFRSHGLVPYVKFLAGAGTFTFPYSYAHGDYLVLAPGAGVDYGLSERLKVRLINVEYQNWRQFEFGNLHPYGVSVGISYRILNCRCSRLSD